METQNYKANITAKTDINTAFNGIQRRVPEWWTPNLQGTSEKTGDEFTVRFGDTTVTFMVTELVERKKIVWLVTESCLPWQEDKSEWTGTRVVWEFKALDDAVEITMTHVGLTPEVECHDNCVKGWNFYFKESFYKLITENKGMPNTPPKDRQSAES